MVIKMKNLIEVKLKSSSHFYDEPFPHGFLFCMSACVIIEFLSFWHICWFLAASSDKKKKKRKKMDSDPPNVSYCD